MSKYYNYSRRRAEALQNWIEDLGISDVFGESYFYNHSVLADDISKVVESRSLVSDICDMVENKYRHVDSGSVVLDSACEALGIPYKRAMYFDSPVFDVVINGVPVNKGDKRTDMLRTERGGPRVSFSDTVGISRNIFDSKSDTRVIGYTPKREGSVSARGFSCVHIISDDISNIDFDTTPDSIMLTDEQVKSMRDVLSVLSFDVDSAEPHLNALDMSVHDYVAGLELQARVKSALNPDSNNRSYMFDSDFKELHSVFNIPKELMLDSSLPVKSIEVSNGSGTTSEVEVKDGTTFIDVCGTLFGADIGGGKKYRPYFASYADDGKLCIGSVNGKRFDGLMDLVSNSFGVEEPEPVGDGLGSVKPEQQSLQGNVLRTKSRAESLDAWFTLKDDMDYDLISSVKFRKAVSDFINGKSNSISQNQLDDVSMALDIPRNLLFKAYAKVDALQMDGHIREPEMLHGKTDVADVILDISSDVEHNNVIPIGLERKNGMNILITRVEHDSEYFASKLEKAIEDYGLDSISKSLLYDGISGKDDSYGNLIDILSKDGYKFDEYFDNETATNVIDVVCGNRDPMKGTTYEDACNQLFHALESYSASFSREEEFDRLVSTYEREGYFLPLSVSKDAEDDYNELIDSYEGDLFKLPYPCVRFDDVLFIEEKDEIRAVPLDEGIDIDKAKSRLSAVLYGFKPVTDEETGLTEFVERSEDEKKKYNEKAVEAGKKGNVKPLNKGEYQPKDKDGNSRKSPKGGMRKGHTARVRFGEGKKDCGVIWKDATLVGVSTDINRICPISITKEHRTENFYTQFIRKVVEAVESARESYEARGLEFPEEYPIYTNLSKKDIEKIEAYNTGDPELEAKRSHLFIYSKDDMPDDFGSGSGGGDDGMSL